MDIRRTVREGMQKAFLGKVFHHQVAIREWAPCVITSKDIRYILRCHRCGNTCMSSVLSTCFSVTERLYQHLHVLLTSPKRQRISLTAPTQPRNPINMVRAPTPVRIYAPTFEVVDEVSVENPREKTTYNRCTFIMFQQSKINCSREIKHSTLSSVAKKSKHWTTNS